MFASFLKSRGGSVMPVLALSFVPIMAAVAGAVDYSHANWVKTSLQAAVDATALMLAKTSPNQNAAQVQSAATAFFLANFTRTDAQNPQVTASYTQAPTGGFVVTVSGTTTVTTSFMNVLGITQIPIASTGTVMWNNGKLRVSLVLDNTGSMADNGKITALKTASHNLLNQLQAAAQNDGDVYVSIVPFAKDVNVGSTNSAQPWIEWSGASDTWDENNGTCSRSGYNNKSSCTLNRGTWTPKSHSTWNGCVMDRDQNFDTTNTAPVSGGTLFPAEQYSYCPTPLMGLTYDWTALSAKIDAMSPNGGTNQAIGLQWGFQSLTSPPLTVPPLDPNYQYRQIIILLTDGLNTQDRWYGNGSSHSSQVDTRQQLLCDNVKAAGITIYAVQVDINNADPTSTLLQNCASDSKKFFLLTSASQIITTFDSIGTSLAQLHLSQ